LCYTGDDYGGFGGLFMEIVFVRVLMAAIVDLLAVSLTTPSLSATNLHRLVA
jgi:hypothetical protein